MESIPEPELINIINYAMKFLYHNKGNKYLAGKLFKEEIGQNHLSDRQIYMIRRRMEAEGLIEKEKQDGGGRHNYISISAEGINLITANGSYLNYLEKSVKVNRTKSKRDALKHRYMIATFWVGAVMLVIAILTLIFKD